jgi:hypothetical protein
MSYFLLNSWPVCAGWLINSDMDASSFDIQRGVFEGLYVGSIEILDACPGESAGGDVGLQDDIQCLFSDPFTNYDYYNYRTIRVIWSTVPPLVALEASGPKAGVSYFGSVTFSTPHVFATLKAGAQTPSTFSMYIEQQARAFATGITDRSFPFIDQPSRASLLNLRPVTLSSYAILPRVAPDDEAINLHLQLYSRCNSSEVGVTLLVKSSKACSQLQASFWNPFRDETKQDSEQDIQNACSSSCFLEFRRRLKTMVAECSRAWKECPESCFSPPSQSSNFTVHAVSAKQIVARRLLQKLIHAAEALRRTSTYCEKNHWNSRCTSISPRSDSITNRIERDARMSEYLRSCSIFVSSSISEECASMPGLNIMHSPWNPPFFLAPADVDPDSAESSILTRPDNLTTQQLMEVECPSNCAQGVNDYIYDAGRCQHCLLYVSVSVRASKSWESRVCILISRSHLY